MLFLVLFNGLLRARIKILVYLRMHYDSYYTRTLPLHGEYVHAEHGTNPWQHPKCNPQTAQGPHRLAHTWLYNVLLRRAILSWFIVLNLT